MSQFAVAKNTINVNNVINYPITVWFALKGKCMIRVISGPLSEPVHTINSCWAGITDNSNFFYTENNNTY